jgi:hypothetical protein
MEPADASVKTTSALRIRVYRVLLAMGGEAPSTHEFDESGRDQWQGCKLKEGRVDA